MGKLVKHLGTIDRSLNKKEIVELAKENAQAILDSNKYDLLKVYIELKRYEGYLKGIIQHLKEPALVTATDIGQKSFKYDEALIRITTRTKWNYSIDNEWKEIDSKIQQLIREKKEREKFLKETNFLKDVVDEETGELIGEFELPKEIEYGISVKL
jgi:uncharacterized protein YecA (UPF0149 family)